MGREIKIETDCWRASGGRGANFDTTGGEKKNEAGGRWMDIGKDRGRERDVEDEKEGGGGGEGRDEGKESTLKPSRTFAGKKLQKGCFGQIL